MGDFVYEEHGYILNLPINNTNYTNLTYNSTGQIESRTDIIIFSIGLLILLYISSMLSLLAHKQSPNNENERRIRRQQRGSRRRNNISNNPINIEDNIEEDNIEEDNIGDNIETDYNFMVNQLDRNHNSNMIELINYRISELYLIENTKNTNELIHINDICGDYILQENHECIICKEEFAKNYIMKQLKCEHYFCEQCIHKWCNNNNTCPICRRTIY
jgi:hypothetical protein